MASLPLSGVRVLDFSTLLPGPLATLLLADAGASVVKIERPTGGDPGRARKSHGESIDFGLLNRGKKSVALDLKRPEDVAIAKRLASEADVLLDQFRPGVMQRLGLGYDALKAANPGLIYCAITGFGQTGPLANVAAHDLNYQARSGLLSLSVDREGTPVLPQGQLADIGGGSFPAVLNILLALLRRKDTGQGAFLDIAMTENTFTWMRRALSPVFSGDSPALPSSLPSTGGSARYGIYRTRNGPALTVAALEPPFWKRFCDLIGLSETERDESQGVEAVRAAIAGRLMQKATDEWIKIFSGEEVCVETAVDVAAAVADEHFVSRGVFRRKLQVGSLGAIPALPVPIAHEFVSDEPKGFPALGSSDPSDQGIWDL